MIIHNDYHYQKGRSSPYIHPLSMRWSSPEYMIYSGQRLGFFVEAQPQMPLSPKEVYALLLHFFFQEFFGGWSQKRSLLRKAWFLWGVGVGGIREVPRGIREVPLGIPLSLRPYEGLISQIPADPRASLSRPIHCSILASWSGGTYPMTPQPAVYEWIPFFWGFGQCLGYDLRGHFPPKKWRQFSNVLKRIQVWIEWWLTMRHFLPQRTTNLHWQSTSAPAPIRWKWRLVAAKRVPPFFV